MGVQSKLISYPEKKTEHIQTFELQNLIFDWTK
jgi:hypothetical protein